MFLNLNSITKLFIFKNIIGNKVNLNNICRFGLPNYNNLYIFDNYISSYDCTKRIPLWTLHYLGLETYNNKKKKKFGFKNLCHDTFLPDKKDYKPYSRGHLVPVGDFVLDSYRANTFYLEANIIPQNKQNNEGIWNRLETFTRQTYISYSEAWVLTGVIFKTENDIIPYIKYRVLNKYLAVPNYIYKVILFKNDNKFYLNSYMIPNIDVNHTNFTEYLVDYKYIEKIIGYNIFNKIDRDLINNNVLT